MAIWKDTLFLQRAEALRAQPALERAVVDRLLEHLKQIDDWTLSRLNPYTLADATGLPVAKVLDTLLHGVRQGVFDFQYNLLCPMCGGLEHNHLRLDSLPEDSFFCTSCDLSTRADLDDQVEVAFSINRALADLDLNDRTDPMYWRKKYYSPNYRIHPEVLKVYMHEFNLGGTFIPAGEDASIDLKATEGDIRLVAMELHALGHLLVSGEPRTESLIVDVDLSADGVSPASVAITPGPVSLRLHNRTGREIGVAAMKPDVARMMALRKEHPTETLPWLTARSLLNTQTFRDLFKVQELNPSLRLHLKSLTLLFTDLKGSTEMYDRAGDVTAYRIVQEHFDLLTDIVRAHDGAVIKTMGDAIMAAFNDPADGVKAALAMHRSISEKAPDWKAKGHEIGLKVGLHEGNALAVNADDRLDYFGQNVNIAARVQGLSAAGEIWMTESLAKAHGVGDILKAAGHRLLRHQALLKGVTEPVTVFQIPGSGVQTSASVKSGSPAKGKPKKGKILSTKTKKSPSKKRPLAKGKKR